MNESSLNNNGNRDIESESIELLTPENTSKVSTLTELWSLAKMVKDLEGDSIWNILYRIGCNPIPFENLGYSFDYNDLRGLYFPMKKDNQTIRFVIPKLVIFNEKVAEEIRCRVNIANSMIAESKFTILGDEVWLIHERYMAGDEDSETIVEHILQNLRQGTDLFHKLS